MGRFQCFGKCGFNTDSPTRLNEHYQEHADHRPPYWNARHLEKRNKKARHTHLSVVGSKVKVGKRGKRGAYKTKNALRIDAELSGAISLLESRLAHLKQTQQMLNELFGKS